MLTDERPGSDVVAAMGAAMGCASIAFAKDDPAYSMRLLHGAFAAYDFAARNQGAFAASGGGAVAAAAGPYRASTTFFDDLAWCAFWLAIRTGDYKYKMATVELYDRHRALEAAGKDGPNAFGARRAAFCVCEGRRRGRRACGAALGRAAAHCCRGRGPSPAPSSMCAACALPQTKPPQPRH